MIPKRPAGQIILPDFLTGRARRIGRFECVIHRNVEDHRDPDAADQIEQRTCKNPCRCGLFPSHD
jgi:hypothetical protein